jgi:hypothetical protein
MRVRASRETRARASREMRARASRETRALDNSLKLLRGLRRCDTSGGELLVFFFCNRGYMFYTMRKGLSKG